ncbi:MAG: penicillin acylase family protein, partial [Acidobacteria bacterium]|nr:penicillin acylase family protein [Acidobacteriota bacterium]
ASITWRGAAEQPPVTGVTLPGLPSMVVGSNGHIAWGFTNTTADWSDRIILEVNGEGPAQTYATPDGPKVFEVFREEIAIAGQSPEVLEVRETLWGPVEAPDAQGRLHAIVWVPHFVEGLSLSYRAVEEATTIEEALHAANLSGVPAQNIVMGDTKGNIAWTVAGRIPRRVGFDGSLPTSWADGTRKWDGWYSPEEYPRIVNPTSGVIVTANNRIVSDQWLTMMGDGGYDPGARARQIRDGLLAQPKVSVEDSRRVHLDDRAVLMDRWRALARATLTASDSTPARAEFLALLDSGWTGRASVDSVGYRLARQFRTKVAELVWAPFVVRVRTVAPNFPAVPGRALEGPVWALVTQRPMHLLDPKYQHWNALLLDAIDQSIASLTTGGRLLRDRTWGEANTLAAAHPLSRAVPQLAVWLDLPREPLPGDNHMPRFQSSTNGASERFTVSPGFEGEGYFHMPGGQSGNPRSPHYRDGHRAWVTGEATPFLPGKTVATLRLTPQR